MFWPISQLPVPFGIGFRHFILLLWVTLGALVGTEQSLGSETIPTQTFVGTLIDVQASPCHFPYAYATFRNQEQESLTVLLMGGDPSLPAQLWKTVFDKQAYQAQKGQVYAFEYGRAQNLLIDPDDCAFRTSPTDKLMILKTLVPLKTPSLEPEAPLPQEIP